MNLSDPPNNLKLAKVNSANLLFNGFNCFALLIGFGVLISSLYQYNTFLTDKTFDQSFLSPITTYLSIFGFGLSFIMFYLSLKRKKSKNLSMLSIGLTSFSFLFLTYVDNKYHDFWSPFWNKEHELRQWSGSEEDLKWEKLRTEYKNGALNLDSLNIYKFNNSSSAKTKSELSASGNSVANYSKDEPINNEDQRSTSTKEESIENNTSNDIDVKSINSAEGTVKYLENLTNKNENLNVEKLNKINRENNKNIKHVWGCYKCGKVVYQFNSPEWSHCSAESDGNGGHSYTNYGYYGDNKWRCHYCGLVISTIEKAPPSFGIGRCVTHGGSSGEDTHHQWGN